MCLFMLFVFQLTNLLIQLFDGRVRGTQGPTLPPHRILAVIGGGPFLVIVRGDVLRNRIPP